MSLRTIRTFLLLETIADEAITLLQEARNTRILEGFTPEQLQQAVENEAIDALITRGKGQVNQALISALPNLKVITRCGVGLDNIDVEAATKRGIPVVNAPGSNAATMAEHTITLMLMLQRNLVQSVNNVKAGNWNSRNTFRGDEVRGKTLGILGLGNIGKRVAKIAEALGMDIIYWDTQPFINMYQYVPLEKLLANADVVTIHLPLLPETKYLINAERLKLMKPTAMLLNNARGAIIDQKALYNALLNGTIAAFGADVLENEPPLPEDYALIELPNTLITPHVGSLTTRTYTEMCVSTVTNTLAILDGDEPDENCIFNRDELEEWAEK